MQTLLKQVCVIGGSLFICAALASSPSRADLHAAAVKQAFARLAEIKTYRIQIKGSSGGVKIDSRIDAQFPDHFHILNRGPNASELILTPDGSFAKTGADTPWRTVPMSYLSIAESMGAKANENLLKSMRNVTFKGAARCPGNAAKALAKQYQFETDSLAEQATRQNSLAEQATRQNSDTDAKAPMRTTLTIATASGLPCQIRAQQNSTGLDTTASYDYTRKFSISVPK